MNTWAIGGAMTLGSSAGRTPSGEASFLDVLSKVVRAALGDSDGSELREAMRQMCAYFGYDRAFMYELNPSKGLSLYENFSLSEQNDLPAVFSLVDLLEKEQVEELARDSFCCFNRQAGGDEGDVSSVLCSLFDAQSGVLRFVLDDSGSLSGCVGMCAHDDVLLAKEDAELADTALIPLSEQVRLQVCSRKLGYTDNTLESIMDHIGFDIYVNDFDTHEMLYANKSMAEPYGGWESMRGKPCYEALYDDKTSECEYCPKRHLIDEDGNPTKLYSWDYCRPFDGRWFRVISAAFQWTDGRLAQVISSTDINDAKNNEMLVQRMAYCDMLTGIANRRKLEIDLSAIIDDCKIDGSSVAVLFFDLDNFKEINDHYGHHGGDMLLQHVSQLFSENPLTQNRCYRYGGDEFVFVFEDIDSDQARAYGKDIVELLETPLELEGDTIVCTGSFGMACFPESGEDFWDLLDRADDAMYENKEERRRGRA